MPRSWTGLPIVALGLLLLSSAVALPPAAIAQTSGPDRREADAGWAALRSDVLSPGRTYALEGRTWVGSARYARMASRIIAVFDS